MANLTPLFTGLAKGLAGYRRGQLDREELDREREQSELRNMLAIYAEQRADREAASRAQQDAADRTFRREQFDYAKTQDAARMAEQERDRQDTYAMRMRDSGVVPVAGKGFAMGPSKQDRENAQRVALEEALQRVRARYEPAPAPQVIQTADGLFTLGRDGKLTPLQNPQGGTPLRGPSALAGRAAIPTGEERKGAALLAQAEEAYGALQQYAPSLKAQQLSRVPVFGNTLAGRADPEAQAAQQAGFQFADAYLRFVSGAAVPETEVRRYMMTFLPQPGDSPETVERKKSAQATILKSLRIGAGRAAPELSARSAGPGLSNQPPPPAADDADAWAAEFLRRKRGGG